MTTPSDQKLLTLLRAGNNSSYHLLYKNYFPSIASYIKQNKGREEDAEDIFQESVIILLQKVGEPDFVLTSSLKTFLFSISKYLWLKHLRQNRTMPVEERVHSFSFENIAEQENFEIVEEEHKIEQVSNWLQKITENCQRVLKALFFYKEPMEVLMKKMGWKNMHTASNQKYKCIEQLRKESKISKEV